MPPPKSTKPTPDIRTLIDITKSTQTLLTHFQSSLTPTSKTQTSETPSSSSTNHPSNPLETLKTTTTLLKSHTTTLSLLLLTPPLTPSAVLSKLSDVSTSVLSGMVAAASVPLDIKDPLGNTTRRDVQAQVRRLLGTWGDVLALVLKLAEKREGAKGKDNGPTEADKQDILAATGVVWEVCDGLLKTCRDGIVGVVVRKAEELRSTLLDAVEELKEWGEDVADDDDEDEGAASGDEDDDLFGAANKLGKGDTEVKAILDNGVKKLKMVGMLYQALIKRRLKPFPGVPATTANGETSETAQDPIETLDKLMDLLKEIPDNVDDLASALYDLDEDEASSILQTCLDNAKSAAKLVQQNWQGKDDEFTAWSGKWISALEG